MSVTSPRRLVLRSFSASAVLAATVVGGLIWLAAPAGAQYPPVQSCAVSSATVQVAAGQRIAITGSGFPAATDVVLTLHSPVSSLGAVHTDSRGSFARTVRLPRTLGAGSHRILADTASTSCALMISSGGGTSAVAVSQPPHPSGASSSVLAETGAQIAGGLIVGVALIGAGIVVLLVIRRRRA